MQLARFYTCRFRAMKVAGNLCLLFIGTGGATWSDHANTELGGARLGWTHTVRLSIIRSPCVHACIDACSGRALYPTLAPSRPTPLDPLLHLRFQAYGPEADRRLAEKADPNGAPPPQLYTNC